MGSDERVDLLLRVAGVGGALLLLVSLAPWFQHVEGAFPGEQPVVDSAGAWGASWWWGAASLLGVVTGPLAWWLRRTRRWRLIAAASLLPLLGVALVLGDRPAPAPPFEGVDGDYVALTGVTMQRHAGDEEEERQVCNPVRRGELLTYDDGSTEARVGWGLYGGLLLLGGQAYALGGAALLARRS